MVPNQLSAAALSQQTPVAPIDCTMPWESQSSQKVFDVSTDPAVAVEYDIGDVTAPRGDGHLERVIDEHGAHVIGGGPTDHPTRVEIDHGRQVEPALTKCSTVS